MKKRNTILKELQNISRNSKEYQELYTEVKDFFYKLDLYYCYKKNERILNYLESSIYLTDCEICALVPINKKGLLAFIESLNSFVLILLEQPKFQNLKKLYYQKK